MIFYFSGTGNSAWVAESLAARLNEKALFVPDEIHADGCYQLNDDECLGFVFPVYSWGIPLFFENFIKRMVVQNVSYVYFVCTCGDDTGRTKEMMESLLVSKGWKLNCGFAIQMPNTYVSLPGFDVDDDKIERLKLDAATVRMHEVVRDIIEKVDRKFDVRPGAFPSLKSKFIRPLFNKYLITAKYFWINDSCVKCGKCQDECPMHNISLCEGTEVRWNDNCVGCLRCYHSCPMHAIQFGYFTKRKGQYCYKK